jgi:hypothetical protein
MDAPKVGCGTVIAALVVAVLLIVYGPLLTLWCLNMLVIGPLQGALLPYELFTWQWLAALLSGGVVIGGAGARMRKN